MRKKKGFTLIELLAVIVILAIIALISTPLILNTIAKAKKGAFKDAAYGIIKSAELEYTQSILDGNKEKMIFTYENGAETSNIEEKSLKYKGIKPKSGTVIIEKSGKIAIAIYDGKWCAGKSFDGVEVVLSDKNEEECIIDTIPPEITINGDSTVSILVGEPYIDAGATAIDNVDGDLTSSIVVNGTVDINTIGEYELIYTVIDSMGNKKTITRMVSVMLAPGLFAYNGSVQTYTVPISGIYKLELWGAQGAENTFDSRYLGGKGAYVSGMIELTKNEVVYVYVGGKDGYNGGGAAGDNGTFNIRTGTNGGGATDIRIGGNELSNRIIVAGGGGGACGTGIGNVVVGGYATSDGITAKSIERYGRGGTAATNISGGIGGKGGIMNEKASYLPSSIYQVSGGGGGGGYYGGGGGGAGTIQSNFIYLAYDGEDGSLGQGGAGGATELQNAIKAFTAFEGGGGGGGSSYVGGVTDGMIIQGNAEMDDPDEGTEIGNDGDGYARITFISFE